MKSKVLMKADRGKGIVSVIKASPSRYEVHITNGDMTVQYFIYTSLVMALEKFNDLCELYETNTNV